MPTQPSPTLPQILVSMQTLTVFGNCENFGKGDFFYDFRVDGILLAHLARPDAIPFKDGEARPIEGSAVRVGSSTSRKSFEVSGSLVNRELSPRTDDVVGGSASMTHAVRSYGAPEIHTLRFYKDKFCRADATYLISIGTPAV